MAVFLVALGCSGLAVKLHKARAQREAVAVFMNLGGDVSYHYQRVGIGGGPPVPAWALSLFGKDFFCTVDRVWIEDTQVEDGDLCHLQSLTGLRELGLADTQISDAGLVHLEKLKRLRTLNLNGTRITDAGLARLRGLDGLKWLELAVTDISDRGLVHLYDMDGLARLNLAYTRVTEEGLHQLKRNLPTTAVFSGRESP